MIAIDKNGSNHQTLAAPVYRMSDLDGAGGLLSDNGGGTLEEREARTMASTSALRRDLPPIVRVRVVQDAGGSMQQVLLSDTVFLG